MGKNKYIDLFKDMIPAVDTNQKDLWDVATEDGQKEIKGDLWNLNRYISSVKGSDRETQEHFILAVNELYNKNWFDIQHHPKLQWLTLCACSHSTKKTFFHEWIPFKREKDKKTEFIMQLFPNMKIADAETLAAITDEKEIKEYCRGLGWDKKQIDGIKL